MSRFPHRRNFRVVSQRSGLQTLCLVCPARLAALQLWGLPGQVSALAVSSLAALSAPPRRVTAEGSKSQRRPLHKVGQIPFSDICSWNTLPAKAPAAPGLNVPLGAAPGSGLGSGAGPGRRCAAPRGHRQQGRGLARVHLTEWVRKGIVLILETLPSYKSAIWHFIVLVLKSYKNLKLAMLSFHHTAKCSTYFNYE